MSKSIIIPYTGKCGRCGKAGPKVLPEIHHYRVQFGVVCSDCHNELGDIPMPRYDEEVEKPAFWVNKPSVFTPEHLKYLWDTYRITPSLPGGFFRSGNYELAKEFPRYRGKFFNWMWEEQQQKTFALEQEESS